VLKVVGENLAWKNIKMKWIRFKIGHITLSHKFSLIFTLSLQIFLPGWKSVFVTGQTNAMMGR
jgi:hypothetical protein